MKPFGIFLCLAFVGVIFIPLFLLLFTFLFVLKPEQKHPDEDWDAILGDPK